MREFISGSQADWASLGLRGYCCRSTPNTFLPPAFQQCKWGLDLPDHLNQSEACQAGCPPNWLKLAVYPRRCAAQGGVEAYCCQGVKPSEWPRYQDPNAPAPEKSAKVREFELAVEGSVSITGLLSILRLMKNRYLSAYKTNKCPATSKPVLTR
jgi:hypothetical protein